MNCSVLCQSVSKHINKIIAAITNKGLEVPNDISVMGYDDMNIARYTSPPLTTVRIPFNRMAVSATRRLLNLCYNLELNIEYDFPIQLIERLSVKKLYVQ